MHSVRSRGLVLAALVLWLAMMSLTPVAIGQLTVTVNAEIAQDFVNVTVSETDDKVLKFTGTVTVAKPPSPLIVVDVELASSVTVNFTSSVEPETIRFSSSGTEYFQMTVVVPAGIKNITNATATVLATATSNAYPTVEDHDTVLIVVEYPVKPSDPDPGPPEVPDPGVHAGVYCLVSVLIGVLIGGLLYWKKKRGTPKDFEVVYRPRRKSKVEVLEEEDEEVIDSEEDGGGEGSEE